MGEDLYGSKCRPGTGADLRDDRAYAPCVEVGMVGIRRIGGLHASCVWIYPKRRLPAVQIVLYNEFFRLVQVSDLRA